MKFVDFLVKLRVEKACRMLTSTDTAIQEIAQQVGYANAISFGRVFKRVIGVTSGIIASSMASRKNGKKDKPKQGVRLIGIYLSFCYP